MSVALTTTHEKILFSEESPMSVALTTTYENSYFRRSIPSFFGTYG
jgi:hypothetical protein